MKNKNLILSLLFWMLASVAMAVTLPTSSYSGSFSGGAESYEVLLGTGVKMNGTSMLRSSTVDPYTCTDEGNPRGEADCTVCCANYVSWPCAKAGGSESECGELNMICLDGCTNGSRSLPLGSTLLLLPFALVYALVRKRKEETL
jgi:hypothetical protein